MRYDRRRYKSVLSDVNRALLNEWDPVGIRDLPEAHTEYEGYAMTCVSLAMRDKSTEEIASFLASVQVDKMGLTLQNESARLQAATTIRKLVLEQL